MLAYLFVGIPTAMAIFLGHYFNKLLTNFCGKDTFSQ